MKEELLKYCYKYKREYIYEIGQREFDCLIDLVENENIKTFNELSEYGMNYETTFKK